jgi:hypothetical protein
MARKFCLVCARPRRRPHSTVKLLGSNVSKPQDPAILFELPADMSEHIEEIGMG